jgi:hypothetical protein
MFVPFVLWLDPWESRRLLDWVREGAVIVLACFQFFVGLVAMVGLFPVISIIASVPLLPPSAGQTLENLAGNLFPENPCG